MSTDNNFVEGFLEHHGVKGMKWGVRKRAGSSSRAKPAWASAPKNPGVPASVGDHVLSKKLKPMSEDAASYHDLKKKVNTHSVHALSNEELKRLTARFDLEQKYSRMAAQKKTKKKAVAEFFINDLLLNVGKQQAVNFANKSVERKISEAMAKQALKKAALKA